MHSPRFKREISIITVVVVLCIILLYFLGNHNRRMDENILANGIETTGSIKEKLISNDEWGGSYHIVYQFTVEDSTIIARQAMHKNEDIRKAIVGRKYKVSYLPGDPRKSGLYLDETY